MCVVVLRVETRARASRSILAREVIWVLRIDASRRRTDDMLCAV